MFVCFISDISVSFYMRYQAYIILLFSMWLVSFILAGEDILKSFIILPLMILNSPPIIQIPVTVFFIIITILAYLDFFKSQH